MKTLFTAKATSKGGREGHSESENGNLSFELGTPGSSNKTGKVTNPEELFACGYSACFGSAIDHVATQQKLSAKDVSVTAEVSLNADDSGYFLSVVLDVQLPSLDEATAKKLVEDAHQVCPYSKATRGNVEVTLKVNHQPLKNAA